jgi:uncharacterized protein (DUF952 family)
VLGPAAQAAATTQLSTANDLLWSRACPEGTIQTVRTKSQPGIPTFVIFHVVALDDWLAAPDRPYAPASLSEEGFVHCSPDEAVTLAVASTFYRDTPGPLMVLLIDEHKLDVMVHWEAASPVPPSGVAPDTLFPHVYGHVNRDAVERMMEIQRDADGRAVGLMVWT